MCDAEGPDAGPYLDEALFGVTGVAAAGEDGAVEGVRDDAHVASVSGVGHVPPLLKRGGKREALGV